jgi:thiol-disulfide isomerase/thioredoxin
LTCLATNWPEIIGFFLEWPATQELFINANFTQKYEWIDALKPNGVIDSESQNQITLALCQSPYCIALVPKNPEEHQFDKETAKGNIRIPEINQVILLGYHKVFKEKIVKVYGKREKTLLPTYEKVVKFNAAHFFTKNEDIFDYIAHSTEKQLVEIPELQKSRQLRHLNLIRNYHDTHIRDATYSKFRWNIITYCLYQGNMRILDWLLANFECSL